MTRSIGAYGSEAAVSASVDVNVPVMVDGDVDVNVPEDVDRAGIAMAV